MGKRLSEFRIVLDAWQTFAITLVIPVGSIGVSNGEVSGLSGPFSGDWRMTISKDGFGFRVTALRERLRLTQEAMAETLGVGFAMVNDWTASSQLALRQIWMRPSVIKTAIE